MLNRKTLLVLNPISINKSDENLHYGMDCQLSSFINIEPPPSAAPNIAYA